MARVALYVSGHGFGHAVRSAQVAAALLDAGAQVVVRTDAPAWLFPTAATYLPGAHGGWGADPQEFAESLHEVLQSG